MSDEKEKPEPEITELTDEVREELEDAIASRPHRAPKIMTEGIKPELDMTITEEKFLDGAVVASESRSSGGPKRWPRI